MNTIAATNNRLQQVVTFSSASLSAITLISVLLSSTGCTSPEDTKEPTYPARGQLFLDGAPAVGAMVKFYAPGRQGRLPTAIVREDGSFAASFYGIEDGVPQGEYALLVLWMVPPPEGGLPQDRLEGRFSNPAHPVRTVKLEPGGTNLGRIDLNTRSN